MATLDDVPGSETLGQILATYYKQRTEYEDGMKLESLAMTALYLIQLVAYWEELKKRVEDRDKLLEREMKFLKYLHDRRVGPDAGELNKKDAIRTQLGEIGADVCSEAVNYKAQTLQDAESFGEMEEMFAECSCAGIPDGWGVHDYTLAAGVAATSAGTVMPTMAKRRAEEFNLGRIELIRGANIAIRSLFTADSVLAYYQQAVAIYQGLIDTFIGGFNSAGAGLGVALQRLSGANWGGGSSVTISPLTINTGASTQANSGNVQVFGEP